MDVKSRIERIIDALISDELIPNRLVLSHPNYFRLLEMWEEYLILDPEDNKKYDALKAKFIECFGGTWFDSWLHETYYFHRTATMEKYGLIDTNEREV